MELSMEFPFRESRDGTLRHFEPSPSLVDVICEVLQEVSRIIEFW